MTIEKKNLILGTVQLGLPYGVQGNGQPNMDEALEILNLAYSEGIVTFDTALDYGEAELILNQFIRKRMENKEAISIITKSNAFIEELENSAKQSLTRLGINRLEGFLFHNPDYLYIPEALTALKRIKDKGLTNKIGASVYTPEQAMKALEYNVIDLIQVPYNIFDRRLDGCGFFETAKVKGVEIHARSVLLQGLLMIKSEHLPANMRFSKPYLELFQAICKEHKVEPFTAAVGFALQHDFIDGIVFGVDNQRQLEEYTSNYCKMKSIDIRSIFENYFLKVDEQLIMPTLW